MSKLLHDNDIFNKQIFFIAEAQNEIFNRWIFGDARGGGSSQVLNNLKITEINIKLLKLSVSVLLLLDLT